MHKCLNAAFSIISKLGRLLYLHIKKKKQLSVDSLSGELFALLIMSGF